MPCSESSSPRGPLPVVPGIILSLGLFCIGFGYFWEPDSGQDLAAKERDWGLQDPRKPKYSTDPDDPFPMPPELLDVDLLGQSEATKNQKSVGCIVCHKTVGDPHGKNTLRIGCTDCHGGDAAATEKEKAHVAARNPQFWPTSANPVRSYTLLNHESPEFIRFVNPGDLRVAHISCGTTGCHPKEVQTNRKQIMSTGAMLWGAALYNNGSVPFKRARFGEAYSMKGAPLRLVSYPAPDAEEMRLGVVPYLDPLPRFEVSQPGNILRFFERGGRFRPETGIPERTEEPGRPRTRLSDRGIGTQNRTDPVFVSLNKTRLFDPTLNFLGTNDHPGDYRSGGCTACHVIYANDRSTIHSGPYANNDNRGLSKMTDPTIPKNESGHPIDHKFTSAIPTSQCIVCHVHPGTTVMNSYLGYMWWDQETEGDKMYPKKQKYPTSEEIVQALMANPEESAVRGNWSDPAFLDDIQNLNPHMDKAQFGDFHSHGWVFRAVFKRDRRGMLLDYHGNPIPDAKAKDLAKAVSFPTKVKDFHKDNRFDDPVKAVSCEREMNAGRNGTPVHLMDIHLEKGMHCVDCHFSQDMHGNNRLHMEVRAACEIQCIDCHGTSDEYAKLRTSGPASYTSAPDKQGRNLRALNTPFDKPRFEVIPDEAGRARVFQNSMVEKGLRWEIVQTKDTIDPTHGRYNAKSAMAKTVRFEDDQLVWGDTPDKKKCAHQNDNMHCIACHSSWNPSCFGCHLPQKANLKMPQLHADGEVSRNFTPYNFQTLREDIYMLARDGDATNNRIGPARSSCDPCRFLQRQSRSDLLPTTDAFRRWLRGHGVQHQCSTYRSWSRSTRNQAVHRLPFVEAKRQQRLDGSTPDAGYKLSEFDRAYCWVGAGEEGLYGVVVTEREEPQAVIGSNLHAQAYPDFYRKHQSLGRELAVGHEHPGRDIAEGFLKPLQKNEILGLQQRGEYLYAACGEGGMRIFDIAMIDNKAFAERITTAPVSPIGQRFVVPSKFATSVAVPSTVAVDPTRKMLPENKEQAVAAYFGYVYVTDKYEGLILVGIGTTVDGDPDNNFLKRALTFNPDGLLNGAQQVTIVGSFAYVCADAGLVVISLIDPLKPVVTKVIGTKHLHKPKSVQVQFQYAYVCDEEGIKILDVTELANPIPKSKIDLPDAHNIYLARTYAYVAAGKRGLVILDITKADEPRLDQIFDAEGLINDAHDVKLGITYNSEFAYIADGKNGLRVVQLTSPETPGNDGFSPPTPKLIATFKIPFKGHALAISKGLDRDRAADELGNQLGVFGRVGVRPLNFEEQRKMYLHEGKTWFVSDNPLDAMYERKLKPKETSGKASVDGGR